MRTYTVVACLLTLMAGWILARADETPDWSKEKFTVIEHSETGAVAMSAVHDETKDIKWVYLLVYMPGGFEDKTTAAVVGKVEFNCTLSQQRWGVATRLDEQATPIGIQAPRRPDWFPVEPKADALFEAVCGHGAQPTQEAQT